MKIAAVIAEYNPFHNGHAYQYEQIKEITGADYIIVICSGDFVQRGEPAIIDKYCRAKMALSCGADLILELPVLFSTGSAWYFANGGISLLKSLGCIDAVCFGTETADKDTFLRYASILKEEPEGYKKALSGYLKQGCSFPAARSKALCDYTGSSSDFMNGPNNILGLEYCRAILQSDAAIDIVPLPRTGEGYHSLALTEFASASAIRSILSRPDSSKDALALVLPRTSSDILQEYLYQKGTLCADDFSGILGYELLKAECPDALTSYFDIHTFLANRIFQKRYEFQTFSQFADLIKTRNETRLHINRALLHIILNLKVPEQHNIIPAYTRILGMKKSSSPLLHRIKEVSSVPVISKLGNSDTLLSENGKLQLSQTTFASNLYQSLLSQKYGSEFRHEYTRQFPVL